MRFASRTGVPALAPVAVPAPRGVPTIESSPANAKAVPSRGTAMRSAPRSSVMPSPSSTAMWRSMPGKFEKGARAGTSAKESRQVHGASGSVASVAISSVEPSPFFHGPRRYGG